MTAGRPDGRVRAEIEAGIRALYSDPTDRDNREWNRAIGAALEVVTAGALEAELVAVQTHHDEQHRVFNWLDCRVEPCPRMRARLEAADRAKGMTR